MFKTEKAADKSKEHNSGSVIPDYFVYSHPEYRPRLSTRLSIGLIRMYQLIVSPIIRPACRYVPTCSEYTLQAIRRFGFLYGSYLGARRIIRCHPFARGGYDPVPR